MAEVNGAPETSGFVAESGPQQAQLLELYSSEGCSSCPPADAFIARLKASPSLWQQWVPVVFHVDYWDYLGWRDPYAQANFSRQQKRYEAQGNSGSVYTPQFLLTAANGVAILKIKSYRNLRFNPDV